MAEIVINGTVFHMSDRAKADMLEGARLAEEKREEEERMFEDWKTRHGRGGTLARGK